MEFPLYTFKDSEGTSVERAVNAMGRIGPSTYHALVSTILATIVLGFSKSFVFEIFFKCLFLVTIIGGSHGLIFLPVLLAFLGGDQSRSQGDKMTSVEDGAIANKVKDTQVLGKVQGA